MANFWKASMKDKCKNGTFLGLLFGLLLASSLIPWINSIVMAVVDQIPIEHFPYMEYIVWGLIGAITGYIIDRY